MNIIRLFFFLKLIKNFLQFFNFFTIENFNKQILFGIKKIMIKLLKNTSKHKFEEYRLFDHYRLLPNDF